MSGIMELDIRIGADDEVITVRYREHPHTGGLRIISAIDEGGRNILPGMNGEGLNLLYGILLKKHRKSRQANDPHHPTRQHIKELTEDSKAARVKTNSKLASELYEMAIGMPDSKALKLMEAAERLSYVELTNRSKLGRN